MTAVLSLDFDGLTDGAALIGGGTTGFTLTDAAAWTSETDNPVIAGSSYAHVVAADVAASIDSQAFGTLASSWTDFFYRTPATAPSVLTYVCAWRNVGTKIGDLRYMSDGSFTLRDGAIQQGDPSTVTVPPNTWVRISILCTPGSATGHAFKLYAGANLFSSTPSYSSPAYPATQASQTSITSWRYGNTSPTAGYTYDAAFDRIRVDDSTEPAPPASGPSQAALVGTGGDGKVTLSWSIPSDGGSAITSQAITRGTSSSGPFTATTVQPGAADTSLVDSTAVNGTTYYYRHTSTNALGTSPAALSGAVTPAAVATSVTILPKAPVAGTGWTLVGAVSGESALGDSNAATYMQSPDNPVASVLTVPLAPLTVPTDKTGWAIDYDLLGLGNNERTVVIKLLQGSTVIATETRTLVPTVNTGYTLVLSAAQAGAIVGTGGVASDLSVQIVATAS